MMAEPDGPVELVIEGMLHSGEAFGRLADGRTVHVPNGTPGDRLRVRITDERKGHLEAEIAAVAVPGPDRVEPPCPHADACGGCDFQFLSAAAQARIKLDLFRRVFQQHGIGGHLPEVEFHRSPEPLGYRHRLRLGVVRAGGRPLIGFRRRHSRQLLEIDSCPVAAPAVNRLLREIRDRHLIEPEPGELVLLAGDRGTGDVEAVFEDRRGGTRWIRRPAEPVRFRTASDLEIGLSPLAFSQANPAVAREIASRIDGLVKNRNIRVVELFAGIGTFTAGLARKAAWVDAVETDAAALAQLKDNLQRLHLLNVKVFPAAVSEDLAPRTGPAGLLVLDPPWDGCEALPAFVSHLKPERIGYVSCHPATLARDLKPVLETGLYRIVSCGLFDQFPMTAHIESVTVLERN